jgi:hypothetical protein
MVNLLIKQIFSSFLPLFCLLVHNGLLRVFLLDVLFRKVNGFCSVRRIWEKFDCHLSALSCPSVCKSPQTVKAMTVGIVNRHSMSECFDMWFHQFNIISCRSFLPRNIKINI